MRVYQDGYSPDPSSSNEICVFSSDPKSNPALLEERKEKRKKIE